MSTWRDFLEYLEKLRHADDEPKPGAIMFAFVNRYLEPMEDIKYRVEFDGKALSGVTTKSQNWVEVQPTTLQSVKVYAWSRVRKDFKLIDEVAPVPGKRLLVNERMKTFKHKSETQPHPAPQRHTPSPAATPAKAPTPPASKKTSDPAQHPQGVEPVGVKNDKSEPEHQANRSPTDKITVAQLKKIFPAAAEPYLQQVADEFNRNLTGYKLDTPLRRAHFFAQVRQEAGSALSPKQENLNYRSGVLLEKFSYYRKHRAEADTDGRLEETTYVEKTIKGVKKKVKEIKIIHKADQVAIANKAYAERSKNGPPESGDGWRFRGRGIFQLTFRDNYKKFSADYSQYWSTGGDDFVKNPDALCEYPHFIRSAIWFWIDKSVYKQADGGASNSDVDSVTSIINPAMDGAAERRQNFHELTYPTLK